MTRRGRLLLIHGADPAAWAEKHSLLPAEFPCECGRPRTPTVPFAEGTMRGLQSEPCECGALPSWCATDVRGCIPGTP